MSTKLSEIAKRNAAQYCRDGLNYYANWDVERAVEAFQSAIALNRNEIDYYLYLAQSYIRLGDYPSMRQALGKFIERESDLKLVERFQAFFGSAMDSVETVLTEVMAAHEVPLPVIGAAIQMWLEFRLARGRDPINLSGIKSSTWAAALDYTIRKVNFHETTADALAEWYSIDPQAVKHYSTIIIETVDVMPCDYRYYRGMENPLDKLVEAAMQLEELESRFYSA